MLHRVNRLVATVLAASTVLIACGGPRTSLPEDDGGTNPVSADAGVPGSEADDGGVTDCLPVSGTGTPILTGIANARRLAADDGFLYVSVRGSLTGKDGKVIRVPLAGGLPSEVATGLSAPDALAISNGVLFVLDDTGLWRVDVGTSAKSRIDTSLNNALFGETSVLVEGSAVIVATGNNRQYQDFCKVIGAPELGTDPNYINNTSRLKHRGELVGKLTELTKKMKRDDLLAKLEAVKVPAGPINNLEQVFADKQVQHRGMKLELKSKAAKGGIIPGVRSPIVMDGRAVVSERASPALGDADAAVRAAKARGGSPWDLS